MGSRRRNRNKGLAEELIEQPWQVSAVLAVASFFFLRWIAPSFFSGMLRMALTPLLSTLSWAAPAGFGFLAVLSFARSKVAAGSQRSKARLEPVGGGTGLSELRVVPVSDAAPASPVAQAQKQDESLPTAWSVEALQVLEWKRFELLCARYYQAVGFQAQTLRCGPDGGIDVKLFKLDPTKPLAIVQCKAWNKRPVGVKEIRELLGVMAHENVARGIFIATGAYTQDATAFGAANPIQLLDGKAFVQKLAELSPEKQKELLAFAFAGDYRTPTCPSCGVKLVARAGKRGKFWGCTHYPKCRYMLPMQA